MPDRSDVDVVREHLLELADWRFGVSPTAHAESHLRAYDAPVPSERSRAGRIAAIALVGAGLAIAGLALRMHTAADRPAVAVARPSVSVASPVPATTGATVSAETSAPTTVFKGRARWLVSFGELALGPHPGTTRGLAATDSFALPESSAFVKQVELVLAPVLTSGAVDNRFIGGSHTTSEGPMNGAAFGSRDGVTLTVSVQQMTGPADPYLISDADFQQGYTQAPDGTETLLVQNDPTNRRAVVMVLPSGLGLRLTAETQNPLELPITITMAQLQTMMTALAEADLPTG